MAAARPPAASSFLQDHEDEKPTTPHPQKKNKKQSSKKSAGILIGLCHIVNFFGHAKKFTKPGGAALGGGGEIFFKTKKIQHFYTGKLVNQRGGGPP